MRPASRARHRRTHVVSGGAAGRASPRNHTDEIAIPLSIWRARVRRMCPKYDPQREAEAAMKRAAASEGADRQRLIQLALAWHELARDRRGERAD